MENEIILISCLMLLCKWIPLNEEKLREFESQRLQGFNVEFWEKWWTKENFSQCVMKNTGSGKWKILFSQFTNSYVSSAIDIIILFWNISFCYPLGTFMYIYIQMTRKGTKKYKTKPNWESTRSWWTFNLQSGSNPCSWEVM